MKRLLLGNEALALGAYMAGVRVATGYPGTPSTEILEHFARYPGVYAEWSPNEKVALEVGIGACMAGARTIVTMKHVGLNVAADPFFAVAYTGVEAGLVVISADDPGMHSSQGEQDNRNYAKFAKVPLLEPSDSQECYDMMRVGLEISERFDTPVLLRTTGRVSHAQSLVEVDAGQMQRPSPPPRQTFSRNPAKYVLLPVNARQRRQTMAARLRELQEYIETTPLNAILWGDRRLGIVTDSIAYQYAREVFPQASFLKLGMAYPFPRRRLIEFAQQVETLLIVEELDPFIEEHIRALPDLPSVRVLGKEVFPEIGEFSPELVAECALKFGGLVAGFVSPAFREALVNRQVSAEPAPALPGRPPVLCPGCGHRATFYTLRQLTFPDPLEEGPEPTAARSPYHRASLDRRRQYGLVVTGDIGCYTLGALQPLFAMDTCGCVPDGTYGNANRPQHDQPGPRGWGGFDQLDEPLAEYVSIKNVRRELRALWAFGACAREVTDDDLPVVELDDEALQGPLEKLSRVRLVVVVERCAAGNHEHVSGAPGLTAHSPGPLPERHRAGRQAEHHTRVHVRDVYTQLERRGRDHSLQRAIVERVLNILTVRCLVASAVRQDSGGELGVPLVELRHQQLRRLARMREGDEAVPRFKQCRNHVGVEVRVGLCGRHSHDEPPLGLRATVGVPSYADERQPSQILQVLGRVEARRARREELRCRAVVASDLTQAPQDVGHVRTESAAIHVGFVEYHECEMVEDARPLGVVIAP